MINKRCSKSEALAITEKITFDIELVAQTAEEKQLNGSLKDLIKIRRHLINLLILAFVWMASAFNYFLINFRMKYI